MTWNLHPRDKPGLLWAVLAQLQDCGARVSLEGYLGKTELLQHPLADGLETTTLQRQGRCWPASDFITLPVTVDVVQRLKAAVASGGTFGDAGWLHHAQIEVDGRLVFGGYDNLHKDYVIAAQPLTEEFFEGLVKNGVLVCFKARTDKPSGVTDLESPT